MSEAPSEVTSAATPSLSLSVGDRVVYPNQGVCRVTGIEAKQIAGQTLTFVAMKREEDGAVVLVPQAKVASIGLRKIAAADEVASIFTFLKAETEKADLDWKARARSNLERISSGGLLGLAEVVKGLQVLSELRPLPTKERELYDNARHLLVAEISAALGLEPCDAEDAIDVVLFPPGKERPKRTAEEFRTPGEEEDLGELGEELGGLAGDLDLPADEEAPADESEASEESDTEEAPRAARHLPATEDDEETLAMGTPLLEPLKKKRGRPPKPKPAEAVVAIPKKRGRPPKPKPAVEVAAPPKKRGRPPKAKDEPVAKKKKK